MKIGKTRKKQKNRLLTRIPMNSVDVRRRWQRVELCKTRLASSDPRNAISYRYHLPEESLNNRCIRRTWRTHCDHLDYNLMAGHSRPTKPSVDDLFLDSTWRSRCYPVLPILSTNVPSDALSLSALWHLTEEILMTISLCSKLNRFHL